MSTHLCQNGQPLLQPGDARLHTWVIPAKNGTFRLTHRNGSMGFILAFVALRFSTTVEDVTSGSIVDDYGEAVRPVRGQTRGYSNHGGYADDLNALRHQLGHVNTFTRRQVVAIRVILALCQGVVRWGGDYHGRKDEMHWEITDGVTMKRAERVAKVLALTPRGRRLLAANPGQKKVIWS